MVNPAEHRGGRRQGPRLPSRRGEARHISRLQGIQHLTQSSNELMLNSLFYLDFAKKSLFYLAGEQFVLFHPLTNSIPIIVHHIYHIVYVCPILVGTSF